MQDGPNPLIEHFKADRALKELEIDSDTIKMALKMGYLGSPACWIPFLWPFQVVQALPVMVCCALSAADEVAKAHHLVLREHSIEYRVEKYPEIVSATNDAMMFVPACCCSGIINPKPGGFHQVFPLEDVTEIRLQKSQTECCGSRTAPDTLVLKVSSYYDGIVAAAAIDAPKDANDFIALVNEQQAKSRAAGGVLHADMRAKYNRYLQGAGVGTTRG